MQEAVNPDSGAWAHWQQLNHWLSRFEPLWRPSPFAEPEPGWVARYPDLMHWVEALTDEGLGDYEQNPLQLSEALAPFLPDLTQYAELVRVPALVASQELADRYTLPETLATDMPGRKRLQSGAFAAGLAPFRGPVLDWCSGKGHLARTLVRAGAPAARGLEWNPALVEGGNRLAQRFADPVQIEVGDVMAGTVSWQGIGHGVALHACGDLHRRLLREAAAARVPRISFSPCCYHLTDNAGYQPLSGRVQQNTSLRLLREEMRLAVRETVTAPRRVREQGNRVSLWRLGFDGLQRTLCGDDCYRPVPPHPTGLNREGFAAFCHWAADQRGLSIPPGTDFDRWLEHGARRLRQVRRHELVRHLFRRPLELWLVLDYVLYLEEAGYRVTLGTFCDRALTPRNLLLDAQKA